MLLFVFVNQINSNSSRVEMLHVKTRWVHCFNMLGIDVDFIPKIQWKIMQD